MKKKKKILILIDWYLPGYKAGGPIKSIASLVEYLKGDYEFYIITSDTDFGVNEPYDQIQSDTWMKLSDSVNVFYSSAGFRSRKNVFNLLGSFDCDLVYLNSFFSYYFSILPLTYFRRNRIDTPILIAPRGMLGAGALQLKAVKKKLFIAFSKFVRLHKKIVWHATSEQEREEIIKIFGKNAEIVVVPNLQFNGSNYSPACQDKQSGSLKLFFLSRISEKKNLYYALEQLNGLKDVKGVVFDIFGPVEDKPYWEKCQTLINSLKQRGLGIEYKGAIPNNEIEKAIAPYHMLFLPSMNENYGHVIVESFFNGKPVLISDQTPWRDLEKSGAGWDIALNNSSKFVKVIESCISMDHSAYKDLYERTLNYAKSNCNSDTAVESMKSALNQLI